VYNEWPRGELQLFRWCGREEGEEEDPMQEPGKKDRQLALVFGSRGSGETTKESAMRTRACLAGVGCQCKGETRVGKARRGWCESGAGVLLAVRCRHHFPPGVPEFASRASFLARPCSQP
jgi:hypothetical protein